MVRSDTDVILRLTGGLGTPKMKAPSPIAEYDESPTSFTATTAALTLSPATNPNYSITVDICTVQTWSWL